MYSKLNIFLILFIIFSLTSCNQDEVKVPVPDVSKIDLKDFKWVRYDQEVKNLDVQNIEDSYKKLLVKYPRITDLYFKRLLEFSSANVDTFHGQLTRFLAAKEIKAVQDSVDLYFSDTKKIESNIKKACQNLKYYFPNYSTPNYYTIQSEFGFQNFIFDDNKTDGIGIGLDLYFGNKFNYKDLDPTNPSFSRYLTRTYNVDHLVKKSMELSVLDLIGDPPGKRFIDYIVNNGKKLYILQRILPTTSDTVILEYSKTQMEWVKGNEIEIWSYFLDRDIIYETNNMKINKYISASPDSPGMPPDAPGRTGNYIGFQIVNAYMKRYPETTLQELIEKKDAQKLMELSKYKPKRR